jgi:Protein of unknown function (DUF3800)
MDSRLTVYIDEGGDSGVKDGLRYHGTRHEWFSLGALVVRSSRDIETVKWVHKIRQECRVFQTPDLHYYKLQPERRIQSCKILGNRPAKAFCLLSHKTNAREHQSKALGRFSASDFYNWCTRLLLERIMFWAKDFYRTENVPIQPFNIIFSENKGHNYNGMFSYFQKLNMQFHNGGHKLPAKIWVPDLIDPSCWSVQPHKKIAGLQLADLVASSFLQAANSYSENFDQLAALSLEKIIAKDSRGIAADVGLTLWPLKDQAPIPVAARPIFEHFGYKF